MKEEMREIVLVEDVCKVVELEGGNPRILVEQDNTDHIYFKCPLDGSELVFTRVEVSTYRHKGHVNTALKLYFICPKCGRMYYRKYWQPEGFGDPKTIEEDLFRVGVKSGWISNVWEQIVRIVVSSRYSKAALEYVGLSRKRFEQFLQIWRQLRRDKNEN